MKAAQKKNRENKASLYENIYTVAGYILSNQEDLDEYVNNAEEAIAYFKASPEERRLAVEAFNDALDPEFDVESYVKSYMINIGKNRDYINYVLTYALFIASIDGNIHYDAKERLVNIGKALGSSQAALKRLFKSNGAEARFARGFAGTESQSSSKSKASGTAKKSSQRKTDSEQRAGSDSGASQGARSGGQNNSLIQQALEILGLTEQANIDDIKRAYKKQMLKYHPDRLAAQNLSEDMIAIYTDKTKAIQGAFDYLKKLYSAYV